MHRITSIRAQFPEDQLPIYTSHMSQKLKPIDEVIVDRVRDELMGIWGQVLTAYKSSFESALLKATKQVRPIHNFPLSLSVSCSRLLQRAFC